MVTVYELFCSVTGKSYVGSTAGKLSKRMREHRCLLRAGKHAEQSLQKDWNQYGEAAFTIRAAIESPVVKAADKARLEVWHMQQLQAKELLYNTHLYAYRGSTEASRAAVRARMANGYRPSAESNEKRRQAQLGIPKGHGAKISATKRRKRDEIVCSTVE